MMINMEELKLHKTKKEILDFHTKLESLGILKIYREEGISDGYDQNSLNIWLVDRILDLKAKITEIESKIKN